MRNLIYGLMFLVAFSQAGCAFLGGAAVGALGTSAAYEINAHNELEKLDHDRNSGRISQREYNLRKSQILSGSIVY
jgi:hypothetical protein